MKNVMRWPCRCEPALHRRGLPEQKVNLHAVMGLARLLGVPVNIHGSFFSFGKKDCNTPKFARGPK